MKRSTTPVASLLACVFLTLALSAGGMSGTTQVAWPGKPVLAEPDWPKGVFELLNDPLRTQGLNPWFSEWPSDVNHYEFKPRDMAELNALLDKFGAIQASNREARSLGFTTVLQEGSDTALVFSIGNQRRLNEWFEGLSETEPGVRKFGVHKLSEAPRATPPTLTLYAGNGMVVLKELRVPAGVEVVSDFTKEQRVQLKESKLLSEIDAFAARHSAPKASVPSQPKRTGISVP